MYNLSPHDETLALTKMKEAPCIIYMRVAQQRLDSDFIRMPQVLSRNKNLPVVFYVSDSVTRDTDFIMPSLNHARPCYYPGIMVCGVYRGRNAKHPNICLKGVTEPFRQRKRFGVAGTFLKGLQQCNIECHVHEIWTPLEAFRHSISDGRLYTVEDTQTFMDIRIIY